MSAPLSEANQTGVNFRIVELDTALTFMNVARATDIEGTVQRNYRNALKAHDVVVRLLPKLKPSPAQRQNIEEKLTSLKEQLKAAGYHV